MKNKSILLILLIIAFFSCSRKETGDEIPFIYSKNPKYEEGQFIQLEELHAIDLDLFEEYYIFSPRGIGADEDTNLYVLDSYECTITAFDKDGKYKRLIARKGQGPYELENTKSMSVSDDKIFVYEDFKGIKELGIKESYSKSHLIPLGSYYIFRLFNDHFLTVQEILKINDENEYYVIKKYDRNFENPVTIYTYNHKIDPEKDYAILPKFIVAQNSKNHIYFPADFYEYRVNVYTPDGNLLRAFGREYEHIKYSDRVIKWKEEKSSTKPYEYPPIVRYIMVDERDYIWIVVGECSSSCSRDLNVNTTVDIFNEQGEFLYTFKTPHIGLFSVIKNGRLYSTPTEEDRNLRVFKIHYKTNK